MKILFAVDGSKCSLRALDYLAKHEWLTQLDGLTVFTVVHPLSQRAVAMAGAALTHGCYADEAEHALQPVRQALDDPKAKVAFDWCTGQPGEEIARKAQDEEFDLILMGSRRRKGLSRFVLGSVSHSVLHRAPCPVLVLRGAESDILSAETAQEMTQRGPKAELITFAGVGHAPALMARDQVDIVTEWLSKTA